MTQAVVFAYHNVGVRCLRTLLDQGIDVSLVLTHDDSPTETIWYDSVAQVCADRGIEAITVDDPNTEDVVERVRTLAPDFIFSFYYRKMLGAALLAIPPRGALNMHGSLLPRYRGRVPVNWAVLHGETETGASLHYMDVKPDAGNLVAQTSVPILGDDTAFEVFQKVTVAAELTLARALPLLVAGTAPGIPLDLKAGSYFSGRQPEDGRIDWNKPAQDVYNLIRAVAPPYPGAFLDFGGNRVIIARARVTTLATSQQDDELLKPPGHISLMPDKPPRIVCGDGQCIEILELIADGVRLKTVSARDWFERVIERAVKQ
jgi:methionyl-tRNA formyltransferase